MQSAAIENFIKKYRLAISSKSKDIRITTEEAGDLVAAIAMINNDRQDIAGLHTKLDQLIKNNNNQPVQDTIVVPSINGGGFK